MQSDNKTGKLNNCANCQPVMLTIDSRIHYDSLKWLPMFCILVFNLIDANVMTNNTHTLRPGNGGYPLSVIQSSSFNKSLLVVVVLSATASAVTVAAAGV